MPDPTPAPMEPFFRATESGLFEATRSTGGPWSPEAQHGGPPSALLAREVERVADLGDAFEWKRMTVEFLRPVPVATLSVRVTPVHVGRQMQIFRAELFSGEKCVLQAHATAVRHLGLTVPDHGEFAPPPLQGPEESLPEEAPFFPEGMGYHKAMDSRFCAGDFGLGASAAWFRMRVPLLDGEVPSGFQRAMITADCVSGTSRVLDTRSYGFANTDLTVHLLRPPVGEWICIDGKSTIGTTGSGMAASTLFDAQGMVGHSLQTLMIALL